MTLAACNESYASGIRERLNDPALRLVFGEGKRDQPPLMWIGEAPGEQEERQGRPFVGKAGQNLDSFLNSLGIARTDVYITNAVKYRPVQKGPTGRLRNRTPAPKEIEVFVPWLTEEIALVAPQHVVTLGNTPLQALLGKGALIGNLHGTWQAWEGIPLYPMYHPAAIIYRRELGEVVAKDIKRLNAHLSNLF